MPITERYGRALAGGRPLGEPVPVPRKQRGKKLYDPADEAEKARQDRAREAQLQWLRDVERMKFLASQGKERSAEQRAHDERITRIGRGEPVPPLGGAAMGPPLPSLEQRETPEGRAHRAEQSRMAQANVRARREEDKAKRVREGLPPLQKRMEYTTPSGQVLDLLRPENQGRLLPTLPGEPERKPWYVEQRDKYAAEAALAPPGPKMQYSEALGMHLPVDPAAEAITANEPIEGLTDFRTAMREYVQAGLTPDQTTGFLMDRMGPQARQAVTTPQPAPGAGPMPPQQAAPAQAPAAGAPSPPQSAIDHYDALVGLGMDPNQAIQIAARTATGGTAAAAPPAAQAAAMPPEAAEVRAMPELQAPPGPPTGQPPATPAGGTTAAATKRYGLRPSGWAWPRQPGPGAAPPTAAPIGPPATDAEILRFALGPNVGVFPSGPQPPAPQPPAIRQAPQAPQPSVAPQAQPVLPPLTSEFKPPYSYEDMWKAREKYEPPRPTTPPLTVNEQVALRGAATAERDLEARIEAAERAAGGAASAVPGTEAFEPAVADAERLVARLPTDWSLPSGGEMFLRRMLDLPTAGKAITKAQQRAVPLASPEKVNAAGAAAIGLGQLIRSAPNKAAVSRALIPFRIAIERNLAKIRDAGKGASNDAAYEMYLKRMRDMIDGLETTNANTPPAQTPNAG
uniref:Uncharacterized protein n=2 Tax=viral metagenome TaxID=1070528 RepID=A0A6M3K5W5_9ZZZZ